jgi:hypothetical protein
MATKKNENLEKYRERYQQIKEKILAACGESPDTCTKELRGFHRSYL